MCWTGLLLSCYLLVILFYELVLCIPVTNNFNNDIRDYSVKEEDDNITSVQTLQKAEFGRYAGFAPVKNPIRFKEIPDNAISSSSYSRGLVHHKGYSLHDYDDSSHGYGHGYDYHLDSHHGYDPYGHEPHGHDSHGHDPHGHDPHGYDVHVHGHHGHHGHHGYGHHHKLIDPHTIAAKAVLLPLAGIAILGAAAALVTNPVLLQLGVISGRKKRDTEEVYGPDYELDFAKWSTKVGKDAKDRESHVKDNLIRKISNRTVFKDAKRGSLLKADKKLQSSIDVTLDAPVHNRYFEEDRYVPIRLKLKNNN